LGTALMFTTSACGEITEPDKVGLFYMEGSSDGSKFDHCTQPGKVDDWVANNSVVFLPTGRRSWLIDDVANADSKELVTVAAAPNKDQPSGVQVDVSSQTGFVLNTYCNADGGVIRHFWESMGRANNADTDAGWLKVLDKTLVPALKSVIRSVIRKYDADALVADKDGVQAIVQKEIAEKLATEINRLAGGEFFCGPEDDRNNPDCPPVQFTLIQVELHDKGVLQARNDKQKAIEEAAAKLARAQGEAAALVAEAQGKADAAAKLATLYKTPGWLELQKTITNANALIEACKAAKECTLVVGTNGAIFTGK
jgi:hypothetical protein